MNQTPKERLGIYLKSKRLSISKFAEQCLLDKSVVSRISETTSQTTLNKIDTYSDLNTDWLLTGEGPMIKEEGNSGDSENRREEEPATGNEQRLIPFYDVETTGGYHGHVSASDEGRLVGYISPGGWFGDSATAAIRHVGDSMTEYPSGCVLAVREVRERRLLVPGRNYVIETREYRVTKRVQRGNYPDTLMLYSSNTSKYDDGRLIHEPFEVSFEDILHIYSVLGYIVNQSGEFKLIKP